MDATRYADQAIAWMEDQDLVFHHRLLRVRRAELALELGRWDMVDADLRTLSPVTSSNDRLTVRALTLAGRLHSRRGDGDPWWALDRALEQGGAHEVQELRLLRAARAEAAWMDGRMEQARHEAMIGYALTRPSEDHLEPWFWGELAFWAWRSGAIDALPDGCPAPYRLHAEGAHRAAADWWLRDGSPWHAALALVESESLTDKRDGLTLALELGARPLVRRAARDLRTAGIRDVPRGPRGSTRRNPAGLTDREVEILEWIAAGQTNRSIAETLVITLKTVDHHVSAVLRKLGAGDRREAREAAARLGITPRRAKGGDVSGAR